MKLTLDLHVHSDASFDGRMSVRQIALLAKARGIDGVAICDHDVVYTGPTEVEGVLIIPGAEFSTEHGHLLGLFLTAPIQHTTWKETVQAIHDQGASRCWPIRIRTNALAHWSRSGPFWTT